MNLRAFLDQDVLVQFRGPWHMVSRIQNHDSRRLLDRGTSAEPRQVSLVQLAALRAETRRWRRSLCPSPRAASSTSGDVFFSYVGTGGREADRRRFTLTRFSAFPWCGGSPSVDIASCLCQLLVEAWAQADC
jgi:hypothetical protein